MTDEPLVEVRSATVAIALVTALISAAVIISGSIGAAATGFGFIAARVGGMNVAGALPVWLTPWSATLIHGGWLHLASNLILLVFVGAQVERVLGTANLILAYLVGAIAAAAAQYVVGPSSIEPMIGASGAISAIFGIYALMGARPKAVTGSRRVNRAIHVAWLLAAWVVIQWMTQMIGSDQGVMLATPAHIGGFIAGLALQRPLLLWHYRRA